MAVSDVKQICSICTEEVTDADYRRELTCSYGACPAKEHAYHEDCITKYLRKLRTPTDQLIGYQCPAVLDNGKPCSGRISGTHHRQPINQKKKQKRVEAAAAAANVPKAKPAVSKPKEVNPCVAAATAAMRPPGDGGVGVSVSNLGPVKPAVPTVKVVAPGSGPAARLKGTGLALANNNTMMPERVVRQHLIPGWSVPEKISKEDRAKIAALQAEAKAAAGRGSKVQPNTQYTQAGQAPSETKANKDGADFRTHQFPTYNYVSDDGNSSESSDTHPFNRYLRDAFDSEDDSPAPQNFFLDQEDFPAFPSTTAAPKCTAIAAVPNSVASNLAKGHEASPPLPSDGSSVSSPASLPKHELEMQLNKITMNTPVTPTEDNEADPVVHYDQLYPTMDERFAVMDVYGNFIYMEDVYGQNPEVEGFDDGMGVITYYVLIRDSMLKAMQEATEAAAAQEAAAQEAAAAALGEVPESSRKPVVPAHANVPLSYAVPPSDIQAMEHAANRDEFVSSFKAADKIASHDVSNVAPLVQPNDTTVDGDQADDLSDLLALCLVRAPSPDLKPLHFADQPPQVLSVTASQRGFGNMGICEEKTDVSAGFATRSPLAVAADGDMADDVDSLMQLLRV
ncbi:hypothetical protein Vretimale_9428 [Volvox reticuliferus]|uniref:Uncharacterized protein n=2 Tax=Volvox reticuliferus TaxID=1737510 RepID=A0A8J4GD94_9CHLO|nr:hypothetical protein Vretimale_9428 [Volvox reticuliferus]